MEKQERPIAWEPHPVTPERKKELIDQGFRIIDAKFKPKDEPVAEDETEEATLTVRELRDELTARGIEIPSHAKKAELAELLKAAE